MPLGFVDFVMDKLMQKPERTGKVLVFVSCHGHQSLLKPPNPQYGGGLMQPAPPPANKLPGSNPMLLCCHPTFYNHHFHHETFL